MLTALIIITSAMSVFGQYVNNLHAEKIIRLRAAFNLLEFPSRNSNKPTPYAAVKKQSDLAISNFEGLEKSFWFNCQVWFVISLFSLLVVAVALEMLFVLSKPEWWVWAYCIYGTALLSLSAALGVGLFKKSSYIKQYNAKLETIKLLHQSVSTAIAVITEDNQNKDN
ncbi:MAG: hypothetical protein Q9M20_00955 [Mariprofundaceae bacterium]|nr:hypothetical protein [Mariprofundaceae bacterium]